MVSRGFADSAPATSPRRLTHLAFPQPNRPHVAVFLDVDLNIEKALEDIDVGSSVFGQRRVAVAGGCGGVFDATADWSSW
jgi:hypothetical protein